MLELKLVEIKGCNMSYVIRLPKSIPNGQCWYDGSDGDPGRTGQIINAHKFISIAVAEKKLAELRKKYPNREFVIDYYFFNVKTEER